MFVFKVRGPEEGKRKKEEEEKGAEVLSARKLGGNSNKRNES